MAEFLGVLARRLVPACDPDVIRTIFETASSGYTGPRTRDGRRASALTPTGVPFEASISGGDGRSTAALRYVTETAVGMPFFAPRLAAQRAALDDLVRWLPGEDRAAGAELRSFVDVLFPDPGAMPARARFATFFGFVHEAEVPGGLAWLKVYGNLADNDGALERLAAQRPAFAPVVEVVYDRARSLVPGFAGLEAAASGERRHKVYCRPRSDDRAAVDALAARCGADTDDLLGPLEDLGVSVGRWPKVLLGCEARDGHDPVLAVYLPARSLGLDPSGMADLVRRLGERYLATTDWLDGLDGLGAAAGASSPGGWQHTGVGVGLRPGGGIGKLNVYVVAQASAGLRGSP